MQRTCEYCGDLFSFRRATKKYCSGNCKQMAYFTRHGFVAVHDSGTDHISPVSVKDVKYETINTHLHPKNLITERDDLEVIMMYAKCLIRNLLQLSQSEYVEHNTLMEFTAIWSQFAHWHAFRKARNDFSFYGLFVELVLKLSTLAKSSSENDLAKLVISEKLNGELEGALGEMCDVHNIRFDEIRF